VARGDERVRLVGRGERGEALLQALRIAQVEFVDAVEQVDFELHDAAYALQFVNLLVCGEAWERALADRRADRDAMQALAERTPDLHATIPHGGGQTYVREVLLVADHTAYHVGQLVLVRRLLGIWSE